MRLICSLFIVLALSACGEAEPTKADDGGELEGASCNTQIPGLHSMVTPRCARYLACVPIGDGSDYRTSHPGICTAYSQEGEACHAKKPCGNPLHCTDKGARAGTCVPAETVAFGETCDFHNLLCPVNHRCVETGKQASSFGPLPVLQCAADVGAGESCDALHVCKEGKCVDGKCA